MKHDIRIGDALTVLKTLPEESVDCIVTSPPYYRLRKYGSGPQELGQEETPQEYVRALVAIFHEAKRVLSKRGTLWLNIGDSYAAGKTGRSDHHRRGGHGSFANGEPNEKLACGESKQTKAPHGFHHKSLLMIPARVAIAMQEDGWILRSEIVWTKPAPIPESVKDRPTRSHEMVYLFSKSDRYFYDWERARDHAKDSPVARLSQDVENQSGSDRASGGEKTNGTMKAVKMDTRGVPKRRGADQMEKKADTTIRGERTEEEAMMANWRDVWTISHNERNPHIAVMPINLVKRCIIAGCPEGGTVLDPFAGSGTTGKAALELKRGCVLIELNPNFKTLIDDRLNHVQPPLFNL